ncbi:protein ENHANCED DOWNY MILDEW 2 isoform X2 [Amborella trichopoda]|uniref:protein ENHANCED DOWNY MILDEW 2 isoform X2 n=1 Tax=Amborella trichopoda TaxID=13333 RepID=UPI0009BD0AC7|nr:protein ENHANCED DOWNY MILDEW 2 isoform X2 [Amborella trichopoda]|eukprot:XP_020530736.1 protein ENHANCED DOWNY MILDEW 2 isoform X2 [Amborella trichopoda]
MASSDDEEEVVLNCVENYHFEDEKQEPISFTVLPIQWTETDSPGTTKNQIFLHGTADSGLQKVYKQVMAWKLDLSGEKPTIYVLTKDNIWMQLQKPRKSFEETIRTILVTVYFLHFASKNKDTSEKAIWDHLRKVFSTHEVSPSEHDLSYHLSLIRGMAQRDEMLANSKVISSFLEEKPKKRKISDEDIHTGPDAKKLKFIVDDDDEFDDDCGDFDADESDEEGNDLFDTVCAICDNGGELLCCEGPCMRSFHATNDAGAESYCKSLGMTDAQVKAIQNFFCKNCQYKRHQCFACGALGSSDKSSGAEVIACVSATCGRHYHPGCVAKLLFPKDEAKADDLQKRIIGGESFTCPIHRCLLCKQVENKEELDLQFAICRRCPKAYHRKCLPRRIAFEELEDEPQRAWDDLIPNRILIYCLKHRIDEDLGTPERNHIKFPEDPAMKKVHATIPKSGKEKVLKKRDTVSEESSEDERPTFKASKQIAKEYSSKKEIDSLENGQLVSAIKIIDFTKKLQKTDTYKNDSVNPTLVKEKLPMPSIDNDPMREERSAKTLPNKGLEQVKAKLKDTTQSKHEKSESSEPIVDKDMQEKILSLIKKSTDSLSLKKVTMRNLGPSTHAYFPRNLDKTITQGKVEGSVEAVRAALQKLEEGGSIEDAKAVCEPEILRQIMKWKNKMKVYLSPFLHGNRYTSFGRHFTNREKLKKIVEEMHWYVQDSDMNDFNFERKDWMSVSLKDLPKGDRLIMGLNPPFGVNAALANKFIDKALEFKPKLVVLIVPKETQRLDAKKDAYDLLWQDVDRFRGHSFYLPGSVDDEDNQLGQWNNSPPPLYFWSRSDWTARHKNIALQQKHITMEGIDTLDEVGHNVMAHDFLELQNGLPSNEPPTQAANHWHAEFTEQLRMFERSAQENEQKISEEPPSASRSEDHGILQSSPNSARQRDEGKPMENGFQSHGSHKMKPANENQYSRRNGKKPKEELGRKGEARQGEGESRQREEESRQSEGECRQREGETRQNATARQKEGEVRHWEGEIRQRESGKVSMGSSNERPEKGKLPKVSRGSTDETPERDESRRGLQSERIFDTGLTHSSSMVSPSEATEINRPYEMFQAPKERGVNEENFHGFNRINTSPEIDLGKRYHLSTPNSGRDESINDIARRYASKEGTFGSGSHNWGSSGVLSDKQFHMHSPLGLSSSFDNRFPGYLSGNERAHGYVGGSKQYIDGLDERYGSSVKLYGGEISDDFSLRGRYQGDRDARLGILGASLPTSGTSLSDPYGIQGRNSSEGGGYLSSLATQRYAPRLDQLNFARPGAPTISESSVMGGFFDPRREPVAQNVAFYGGSMTGFASGPQRPHQGSSGGWLNE